MSRRIPHVSRVTPAAVDASPVYSSGRGDAMAAAIMADIEDEAERRSELYAALNQKSSDAMAATRAGLRERAVQLYRELAAAWREGGFHEEARGCDALAEMVLNPPKTIGRKPTRRGR
jgi:hypothetical protein